MASFNPEHSKLRAIWLAIQYKTLTDALAHKHRRGSEEKEGGAHEYVCICTGRLKADLRVYARG